jgi:type IV/VI secretion system ImpK/VasF family protein
MKNQQWAAVYELFQEVERLLDNFENVASMRTPAASPASGRSAAKSMVAELGLGLRQAFVEVDEGRLVKLRVELRARLEQMRARLADHLTEREIYLVLFPLVIYFDEMVQKRFLSSSETKWPPLQKELFNIDDGGEVFYQVLDDLLRKPDTFPFVYEVYYLTLSDGFKGKYVDNPSKIAEYKSALTGKISVPRIEEAEEEAEEPPIWYRRFPIWNYVAAVGAFVFAYGALRLIAAA